MKEYKKEYEDYFKEKKSFNIDDIKIDGVTSMEKYQNELHDLNKEFQLFIFDYLIKIHWLFRKFRYNGKKRVAGYGENSYQMNLIFKYYYRKMVNLDTKLIYGHVQYTGIIDYFDTLFPDFDTSNPFNVKYEYPFKYMRLEHLFFVRDMDERMELLEKGEEKKMSIADFFNYVINYILCYNEDHDRDRYRLSSVESNREVHIIDGDKRNSKGGKYVSKMEY